MHVDIAGQAVVFGQGFLLGAALGLLYDGMRTLRRSIRLAALAFVLDLLFWLAAVAALFALTLLRDSGVVHLYHRLAFLLGGGLFGFVGMVLGVPTFALLYSILRDITAVNLVKRGVDENGAPLPDYMTCQPSDCEAKTPPTESEKNPHSAAPPNERKI